MDHKVIYRLDIFIAEKAIDLAPTEEERNDILSLSMKLLWLYQKLKPGVLTESGFNICKLLFKDSLNGDQNSVRYALDVLLTEKKEDTRLWLEKVSFCITSNITLIDCFQRIYRGKESITYVNICICNNQIEVN